MVVSTPKNLDGQILVEFVLVGLVVGAVDRLASVAKHHKRGYGEIPSQDTYCVKSGCGNVGLAKKERTVSRTSGAHLQWLMCVCSDESYRGSG